LEQLFAVHRDAIKAQALALMGRKMRAGSPSNPSSPEKIYWKTSYRCSAWTVVDLEQYKACYHEVMTFLPS
jgi:hypothetical protein